MLGITKCWQLFCCQCLAALDRSQMTKILYWICLGSLKILKEWGIGFIKKIKLKISTKWTNQYTWWEGEEGNDVGPTSERKLEPSASLTGSEGSPQSEILGSMVESRLYTCTVIASDNAVQSKDFEAGNQWKGTTNAEASLAAIRYRRFRWFKLLLINRRAVS